MRCCTTGLSRVCACRERCSLVLNVRRPLCTTNNNSCWSRRPSAPWHAWAAIARRLNFDECSNRFAGRWWSPFWFMPESAFSLVYYYILGPLCVVKFFFRSFWRIWSKKCTMGSGGVVRARACNIITWASEFPRLVWGNSWNWFRIVREVIIINNWFIEAASEYDYAVVRLRRELLIYFLINI